MPESISSTEILRFCAALIGLYVAYTGRRLALRAVGAVALPSLEDSEAAHDEIDDHLDRLRGTAFCQLMYSWVHLLLLINVVVNFGYISPAIEQPNVLTSNVAQMAIPVLLIMASRQQTARLARAEQIRARVARRAARMREEEHS